MGTSLVVQWRTHLPMQGTHFPPWSGKIPQTQKQRRPRAAALETVLRDYEKAKHHNHRGARTQQWRPSTPKINQLKKTNRTMASHSSGDRKSEIKMSASPGSLWRSPGVSPWSSWLVVGPHSACSRLASLSAPHHPAFSLCAFPTSPWKDPRHNKVPPFSRMTSSDWGLGGWGFNTLFLKDAIQPLFNPSEQVITPI